MPIKLTLDLSSANLVAGADLSPEERIDLDRGALDPDQVWFRFITQGDDRVRPSHRALHGTVWKVGDPAAPVPPLDYGCRCMIEYLAAPDTPAAKVMPAAEQGEEPTTPAAAFADFLGEEFTGWEAIARAAEKLPTVDRPPAATAAVLRKRPDLTRGQAQQWASMILRAGTEA